jgi:hypothetical protein
MRQRTDCRFYACPLSSAKVTIRLFTVPRLDPKNAPTVLKGGRNVKRIADATRGGGR